jgi:hypothetical protein
MEDDDWQIEALAAVVRCSALADPEAPQQMPLLQPPVPVPQLPLSPPPLKTLCSNGTLGVQTASCEHSVNSA